MRIEIRGAERLSFRERQVVALKESGLSNEEVAARLQLASATVATLFRRAKVKGYEVVIIMDGDPLGLFDPNSGQDKVEADEEKDEA